MAPSFQSRQPVPFGAGHYRARNLARVCVVTALSSMSDAAHAARAPKGPKYTPRVRQFLDYLDQHPMQLASIPMLYDTHPAYPLPEVAQNLQPRDVAPPGGNQDSHMARVVVAMMYVACGALDLAHNLVTPYSWGSYTPYGGAPVPNSPAAKEAAYVHALIHRWEGHLDGEFGTGFSNANYWYRAAGDHQIFPHVLEAAKKLSAGKPRLEHHVSLHGAEFSPTRFVTLCSQALSSKDPELLHFCDQVAKEEWCQLFDYCYARL